MDYISVQDIIDKIEQQTNPKKKYLSSLRAICRVLKTDPWNLPAEPEALSHRLKDIGFRDAGYNCRATYQSVISRAKAAIRTFKSYSKNEAYVRKRDLSPEWRLLKEKATKEHGKRSATIYGFINFCSANSIEIADVTDDVLEKYCEYRTEKTLSKSRAGFRSMINRTRNTWNLLGLQKLRFAPERNLFQHEKLSVPLEAEFLEFIKWKENTDIKKHAGTGVSDLLGEAFDLFEIPGLAPATITSYQQALRTVASKNTGDTIKDIVTYENVKNMVSAMKTERNLANISIKSVLTRIISLAVYSGMKETDLLKLRSAVSKLSKDHDGISETRLKNLENLLEPEQKIALLNASQDFMKIADGMPLNYRSLSLAETSIAIAILCSDPMRVKNLASIRINGEKSHLRKIGSSYTIELPAKEMKTNKRKNGFIDEDATNLIDHFVKTYRPFAVTHRKASKRNPHLFVAKNLDHKTSPSVSLGIKKNINRFSGTHATPHLFRHFIASLIVDADPRNVSFAAGVLGNAPGTTAKFYLSKKSTDIRASTEWNTILETKKRDARKGLLK